MSSSTAVRVAGGLLPSDVIDAVLAGSLDGLGSNDYHLGGESPREAAAREWSYLLGVYRRFRDDLARLPDSEPAIGPTRERWLTLLLTALGYGRVPTTVAGGLAAGDKQYSVSHLWGATPIHLLGWGVPLDKRSAGVPGAAHRAPHAMVQELLNRSDAYLWAIVSNGRVLRLVRDSSSLSGQAYVEFDLEAMFDADLFADFALLYLLAHESRVEIPDGGQQVDCWLERWRITAISQGVRAMALLRDGVQEALSTLGTGFLQQPANTALRLGLEAGEISLDDLHQNLLRIVYRLLFWTVAEDRDALLDPRADPQAADRYRQHFSSVRLRRIAQRRHGSAHHDLWDATQIALTALGRVGGEPRLGLPGLGGLFTDTAADILSGARLGNQPLLAAIRALSIVQPKGQPRRAVDFRHLGSEELGSIYESLLELVPRRDPLAQTFSLEDAAGNDRKTTGSYYTPTELVDLVLDTALDPVLDDAEKNADPEAALLGVTCCDPAIGSGHFMVAAARRIASRLATARTGEIDPTPETFTDALHDVIAQCIYGVDVNPMAADLAKVSLWLEAMSPGRPLSFLDHHIKVGNSLLGTTPALLHNGIPDTAYTALTGDDKSTVREWRKLNEQQRVGQASLFDDSGIDVGNIGYGDDVDEISDRAAAAQEFADVAWAAQRYNSLRADDAMVCARRVADGWCVAFLAPKIPDALPITHMTLEQLGAGTAPSEVVRLVDELAARHRLFHWHLEFPEIFRVVDDGPANTATGWTGGFTVMLGNPPWDQVQLHPNEFFASRDTRISDARTMAKRDELIKQLVHENPELYKDYVVTKTINDRVKQYLHDSGVFPLTSYGRLNTYSLFAESITHLVATDGRVGILTPTGLMTDSFNRHFASAMLAQRRLAVFYDFENEARIFAHVHNQFRFAVTVLTGGVEQDHVRFAFYTRHVKDVLSRQYDLTPEEVTKINPNSGTLPLFRSRLDAEITLKAYRNHGALVKEGANKSNAWGLRFVLMFMMNTSSRLFQSRQELKDLGAIFDGWQWQVGRNVWLPLYEAKMVSHWNHRYATYANASQAQLNKGTLPRLGSEELSDPHEESLALHWIDAGSVKNSIEESWDREWFLGWRAVARASDVRTFVPSVIPRTAVSGKFPIAFPSVPAYGPLLQAIWSSLIFDYIARQKQSGADMPYHIVRQLACPSPDVFNVSPVWLSVSLNEFIRSRVLELTYTSYRLRYYAMDVVDGAPGEPFQWNPTRRAQIVAELDAAMLHVYGLDRADAEHVIDSFFVVRKYEERDYGEFRTRRLVLAEYDAMAQAADTGIPYQSPLDPSPGCGPRHPARTR